MNIKFVFPWVRLIAAENWESKSFFVNWNLKGHNINIAWNEKLKKCFQVFIDFPMFSIRLFWPISFSLALTQFLMQTFVSYIFISIKLILLTHSTLVWDLTPLNQNNHHWWNLFKGHWGKLFPLEAIKTFMVQNNIMFDWKKLPKSAYNFTQMLTV